MPIVLVKLNDVKKRKCILNTGKDFTRVILSLDILFGKTVDPCQLALIKPFDQNQQCITFCWGIHAN